MCYVRFKVLELHIKRPRFSKAICDAGVLQFLGIHFHTFQKGFHLNIIVTSVDELSEG